MIPGEQTKSLFAFLQFNSGEVATVTLAEQKGSLVVTAFTRIPDTETVM
jgi:hypothetical protein